MSSVCVEIWLGLCFAAALLPGTHAAAGNFSYDNQSAWGGSCSAGARQSPVFIATINTVGSEVLESLDLVGWGVPVSGIFKNTGSTVKFIPNVMNATMRNHQGLYTVHQFHFHWGENNTVGSEHKVDAVAYAAEAHLVTKKNTGSSGMSGDSFSVVAVLFEADDSATETGIWAKLVPPTADEATINVSDITFSDLLPNNLDYYYYPGSLTTPPCSEHVQWFVLKTANKIPSSYLQRLRQIRDNSNGMLTRDYRDTQPLNTRSIMQFTSGGNGAPTCGVMTIIIVTILCLLFAHFNN